MGNKGFGGRPTPTVGHGQELHCLALITLGPQKVDHGNGFCLVAHSKGLPTCLNNKEDLELVLKIQILTTSKGATLVDHLSPCTTPPPKKNRNPKVGELDFR